jgi:hypothetical protein
MGVPVLLQEGPELDLLPQPERIDIADISPETGGTKVTQVSPNTEKILDHDHQVYGIRVKRQVIDQYTGVLDIFQCTEQSFIVRQLKSIQRAVLLNE